MTQDTWPDWKDAGREVEVTKDGQTRCGTLAVDDVFFDGEDEVPLFVVEVGDEKVTFADHDAWRFTA